MRDDSIGIFWQDEPRKGKDRIARVMPPIPDTGWTTPTVFPNLRAAKALSIDVETKDPELRIHGPGWARHKGHIVGIGAGTDDGARWYFPMRHEIEREYNLDPEHVLAWARDNFGYTDQPKIGANLTYDVGWLKEEGVEVRGPLYDVEFAEALLSEWNTVNLDDLGIRYLGEGKETHLLYQWCSLYYGGKETDDQRKNIYRAPPRLVGPYAEGDVDKPFRVMEKQWPLLAQQGLLDVFDMECRLIYLIVAMRFAGVSINLDMAEQMKDVMVKEIAEVDKEIKQLVGFEINTNAAESIAQGFDIFNIPYPRTKKTDKPSFRKGYLESVEHPLAELVLKKKSREKLKGTFIEGYLLNSHVNGKVHGSFNQLRSDRGGARPGRFSSSNPNLQNIPIRSKLGKLIRNCFIPDTGHVRWRKFDYSQIEYRGLAHYAVGPGSDDVRTKYNSDPNIDFHYMVQQLIKIITSLELERPLVKNINFGTVYGMGEPGLARYLNLPLNKAKELLAAIHQGAPFLRATMDATMEEANRLGYITTVLGRRSRFDMWVPGKWSEEAIPLPYDRAIREYRNPQRAFTHKALNNRLQGSAADLIKMAMLLCWERGVFDKTGVPRLTVHDELDFSDTGDSDKAFLEMMHIMKTAIPFRVPVMVGHEIGPSWGEVEEVAIV